VYGNALASPEVIFLESTALGKTKAVLENGV
jgi:hypothetical protein